MMFTKKKILVFSDWYLPGYKAGGPIRSLANLVNRLEHDFYIITRITDHNSTESYPGITPDVWVSISPRIHVMYLTEGENIKEKMTEAISDNSFDRIYFNSLFSPKYTLLPLRIARKMNLASKCVLAPRGMLKAGALSIKANKKKVFLFIAKCIGLFKGIVWHATNEAEKKEIESHFGSNAIVRIAPNLTIVQGSKPSKSIKHIEELRLVCVARISPEKGILEALKFLKTANLGNNVSCDFFGTQQNAEYLQLCQDEAKKIVGAKIRFMGEIPPNDIPIMMKNYHFFYMPTLGENFGHAISEALISATPVIISNRTPWVNLSDKKAGWDIELNDQKFSEALELCYHMDDTTYQEWSIGAFNHGKNTAEDPASIQSSYAIFE
jgi:glycosyltransferase involved in cell wall biosynthesis